MKVIQEALRDANEQVSGTGELLEEAADEIVRLKRQAGLDKAKIVSLREALEETRLELGQIAGLALTTTTALGQDSKQLQVSLGEILERVRVADQTIRETRDQTNLRIGQALK